MAKHPTETLDFGAQTFCQVLLLPRSMTYLRTRLGVPEARLGDFFRHHSRRSEAAANPTTRRGVWDSQRGEARNGRKKVLKGHGSPQPRSSIRDCGYEKHSLVIRPQEIEVAALIGLKDVVVV
jgi:hypothetical protein